MLSPWKAFVFSSCWEVPRLWFLEKEEAAPTLGSYLGSGPAVAIFQLSHLGGFAPVFLIGEQGEEGHVPCSWDESRSEACTSGSGLAPGIPPTPPHAASCCPVDTNWTTPGGLVLRGGDVHAAGAL